jgi:hypothetical protein
MLPETRHWLIWIGSQSIDLDIKGGQTLMNLGMPEC